MRILLALALAAIAGFAQTSTVITIIPITDPTTGALSDPGSLVFRDLTGETAKISAPDTLMSSYRVRLWDDNTTGCLKNTATGANGVLSIVGCGGLPALDTTVITQNASDPTKQFRLSNAGITAGQTRVATIPDANFTFAGRDIAQTFSGVNTFTANQQIAAFLDFGFISGSFSKYWSIDAQTSNVLSFRDSGGNQRAFLNANGVPNGGGSGVQFVLPSIFATSTQTGTPTFMIGAISSQTADVMAVYNAGFGTKYFAVSPAGAVSASTLTGTGTRPLCASNLGVITTTGCIAGAAPFVDTTSIVEGSSDATKEIRFEVDGLTTGTVRVLTPQNADYVLAGTNIAQTFSGVNMFTANQQIAANLDFGTFTGSFNKYWSIESLTANVLSFRDSGGNQRAYLNSSGVPNGGGSGVQFVLPSIFATSTQVGTPTFMIGAISSQTADVMGVYGAGFSTKYLGVSAAGAVSMSSLAGSGTRCALVNNGGVISVAGGDCFHLGGGQSVAGTSTFATISLSTALAGTFNLSGNLSVTGNFYNRPVSDPFDVLSCSGVANGWTAMVDSGTYGKIIAHCWGGARYKAALATY